VFRTILTTAVGLQFPSGPLVVTVYCFLSLLTFFALKFKERTLKKLSVIQKLMVPAFAVCMIILLIRMISQKSIKGQNDK
jgi:threonine/homoserine/homoserine lactone efflux protein